MPEVAVRRSDPIYNAHGYLTKVPVSAIVPFIERYSKPGDLVLDVFAGSGMTGVAAAIAGRRAILVDISELGRHIATNYLNLVRPEALDVVAASVLRAAAERMPNAYLVPCRRCGGSGTLSRSVWSLVYGCTRCSSPVVFFDALAARGRPGSGLACSACGHPLQTRTAPRIGEQRVQDVIACACSDRLIEQEAWSSTDDFVIPNGLTWPDVPIEADREMFRRSALQKHGLTSTAKFFSRRNLAALAALRDAIAETAQETLRSKLLFAFTAILPRASKRYQWGPKRPLNAQNQTYYVAPVFLEWNVFDLFRRKVEAVKRSDEYIRKHTEGLFVDRVDVQYVVASADDLSFLANDSVDYVFTDPPFGSNIFYSDMSLFHEAWLERRTDRSREAVIPTNGDQGLARQRYLELLSGALRECYRVLKPGAWLSLVFSNSSGLVWALSQQAIHQAGFEINSEGVHLLDKGQRSVKGLASGYEHVVTNDLVMTMRKPKVRQTRSPNPPGELLEDSVRATIQEEGHPPTPSALYLQVIRRYLRRGWDLSSLDFGQLLRIASGLGLAVDRRTGRFQ